VKSLSFLYLLSLIFPLTILSPFSSFFLPLHDLQAMSLVLSYLPDPFLRTRMLTQARKCLQPSPINTTSRDATAPITEAAKTQAGTAAGTELLPSREDDDTNKHPSVSDVGSNVVPPPKGGLLLIVDRWSIARDPPSELALQRKVLKSCIPNALVNIV
jgi:hypothetical protein